ncbi:MAG: hypothetical protein IH616_05485 [Gemmatimonadales bacterium]|nr:hypothetical protein [Gemmatimonadales bacterium]
MTRNAARWVRSRALWFWTVFAAALVFSAACSDVTTPRIIKDVGDSAQDSTQNAG